MTWDEIYVLSCLEEDLERRRLGTMPVEEAIKSGLLKPPVQQKLDRKEKRRQRKERIAALKRKQNGSF